MKICEIYKLKRLAGIIDKDGKRVNDNSESNISVTGSSKGNYQKKHNVQPGTDEWFKLWFAKPKLTGEDPTPKD